eukprot:CAMPEP_0114475138 /NCGR_PEP_ID=MMETSP0104-20121206/13975_1 /TAXON_ID=37642 ORGANISM="Paraphysomonas imperforata, Strain PA2" /NCGR_SAMPLE_ID=MMETSP0104 /ASSEMBLY_ACC=CAM_ASM_000202 /LENGTH=40 /DNA_ID= /DNA_START= /DNA_END= /DNA_ORIENTATION=
MTLAIISMLEAVTVATHAITTTGNINLSQSGMLLDTKMAS